MNEHTGTPFEELKQDSDDSDAESVEEDSDVSMSPSDSDLDEVENSLADSSTQHEGEGNKEDEEEEDPVISAILRAREKPSEKPPEVEVEDYLSDISFSPITDIIAGGSVTGDALIYKYSVEKTELVATHEVHTKAVRAVEFSEDGNSLFTASADKSIMVTDTTSGKLRQFYDDAHEDPLYTLAVINENMIATGDENGVVRMWDLRQRTHVFTSKKMEDYVSKILTNEEARYLVCTSGEGTVTSFDIAGKCVHIQSELYDAEFTCAGLFRKETKLVVGSAKGSLVFYKWGQFGLHTDDLPLTSKKAISCMVPISENIALTGWENGSIRATYLFPHKQLGMVGQHSLSVEALDISHDGAYVASCALDNKLRFWPIGYFEDTDLMASVAGTKKQSNLPSSNVIDRSQFFSDLA